MIIIKDSLLKTWLQLSGYHIPARLLFVIYQQFWLSGEDPIDWKIANGTPIYKNRPEEGPRKLQACQSDLSTGESYEAEHLVCHHTAHTRTTMCSGPVSMSL